MNIYPWYIFSIVAERKSFMKAAGVLNISQSAVSHAIAKLESECGYSLFVRNRNNIELTANGRNLIPFVRQLLNCDNTLSQQILKLKNVQSGEVKIAAFHSATLLWLPEIIAKFNADYPNVKVRVRQSGDRDIAHMIQNGEVDLAIISRHALERDDSFLPLHKTPLVGVTPKEYQPLNGSFITTDDFRNNDFISPYEGYDTEILQYLVKCGLNAEPNYRIEDDDTIFAYIEKGYGLSVMPLMTAQCSKREFKTWSLEDEPTRIIGLVTVYSDYISPAASLLRQQIIYYMTQQGLINL